MAKKKKLPLMERGSRHYLRTIKRDVGPPEDLKDWEADVQSSYMQGWMDALKHMQRLRIRRLKRRH